MPLHPASGTGRRFFKSVPVFRLLRQGCTNRPFYHVVVQERRYNIHNPVIEQVGSYDPMPNEFDEKLVALNYERIKYWLGAGAHLTDPVAEILGLAGILPIHPRTYMRSWRNRKNMTAQAEQTPKEESTN